MRLHWRASAPTYRRDPDDYVRSHRIDVRCFDEHCEREYLVARLAVDHILWADAITDGMSVFHICDNDSQGLHELHVILTDGTNEIRDDLRVEEPVDAVVFAHAAVFHPNVHPYRVPVFDAVFNLFGSLALAVMWKEVGDVPEKDQVQLGLARVAGTGLVFRHNARTTPYSEQYPRGMEADFYGSRDAHRWVREEWKRKYGTDLDE